MTGLARGVLQQSSQWRICLIMYPTPGRHSSDVLRPHYLDCQLGRQGGPSDGQYRHEYSVRTDWLFQPISDASSMSSYCTSMVSGRRATGDGRLYRKEPHKKINVVDASNPTILFFFSFPFSPFGNRLKASNVQHFRMNRGKWRRDGRKLTCRQS